MHKQKLLVTAKTQIMCHISRNRSLNFTYNRSFDFDCCNSTEAFTMDKFVTVTKKSKIGDSAPANSDSDDNSGQSSTSQKSEQLKRKTVVRKFNLQWENDYFVTEHKDKTICLVCRLEFSDNRKHNIERHFTSQQQTA